MIRRGFGTEAGPTSSERADTFASATELALRSGSIILFHTDRQLRYTWINSPILGFSPRELVGRGDTDLFSPAEAAVITAAKRLALTTGSGVRRSLRIAHEGRVCHYELTIEPTLDDRGEVAGLAGVAVDVTQAREHERLERFRVRLSDALRNLHDPQPILSTAVSALGEELEASRVAYLEPTEDDEAWIVRSEHCRGVASLARRHRVDACSGYMVEQLAQGRTVVLNATADDPHLAPEPRRRLLAFDARSMLAAPVLRQQRLVAVLTVHAAAARAWTSGEVVLVEEVARRAAIALENARLRRAAERELAERREAERRLRIFNETLEQRVADRTAEVEQRSDQLRSLAAELTRAEQRERRRLAQLLHDHLQQLLVASRLRLHTLRDEATEGAARALQEVDDLISQAIDASRVLTVELSPPILHEAGLPSALHWLGRWVADKHGLRVNVEADREANPRSENVRAFLFNAVRELLFNVVKHARTRRAEVELKQQGEMLHLRVSDEGAGFDPQVERKADQGGFGLFSVQQRLATIGGEAHIESEVGKGTRIELRVPQTASLELEPKQQQTGPASPG